LWPPPVGPGIFDAEERTGERTCPECMEKGSMMHDEDIGRKASILGKQL